MNPHAINPMMMPSSTVTTTMAAMPAMGKRWVRVAPTMTPRHP
jgi:hypothetical protein